MKPAGSETPVKPGVTNVRKFFGPLAQGHCLPIVVRWVPRSLGLPTLIWCGDFRCGWLLRGCGVSTPGSGTVSKTVSKRPGERPREGVERRPGRLGLRSSVGGHVEPLGGRRLHEKPPPAKGFLSPNRYRSAHHDGRCLVVPVAVTAGNKIESLRQWASGRCLSEDWAGVNSRQKGLRALKRPRGAGLLGIPLPSR